MTRVTHSHHVTSLPAPETSHQRNPGSGRYEYLNKNYLASGNGRWSASALAVLALCAASTTSLMAQSGPNPLGYWHGTSGAVITSPDAIVAAIDSKEVNRQYLNDGTLVRDEQLSCKVRRTGPYYVLIAGISQATDGFSALQEAGNLYRDGYSLDDFAGRLMDALPARLASIVDAVRAADRAAFDQSFRDQDVLQMSLLGAEQGRPRVVMISFHASESPAGQVTMTSRSNACPGDCKASRNIYFLGLHQESEAFVRQHPEILNAASADRALQLIDMEYASHPDLVGGPATVVRVSPTGAAMEQVGACTDGLGLPRLESELDYTIAAVENITVQEDIAQYSRHGDILRSGALHASVRVNRGEEEYAWSGQNADQPSLPQPFCGGELATMMRVTRQVLAKGQLSLSAGALASGEPAIVMSFHSSEADRHWQLVIGSRTYPLAFDGRAWFSEATGKLVRIHWEATSLHLPSSAAIARIEWDETFAVNDIAGRPYLTPGSALYRVTYSQRADRTDWTETRFSDFRRYGSTANISFEQAAIR